MKYITMLPFLSDEDLRELAFKVLNNEEKGVKLVFLFPFLDNETLNEVIDKLIEEKRGKDLQRALPFISSESITKLYEEIKNGNIEGIREESLLPFLDKKQIKDMFKDLLKKAAEKNDDKNDDDDEDEE